MSSLKLDLEDSLIIVFAPDDALILHRCLNRLEKDLILPSTLNHLRGLLNEYTGLDEAIQ